MAEQKSDFSAHVETAVTVGDQTRNVLKVSLPRWWRRITLWSILILTIIWGFSYIPIWLKTTTSNGFGIGSLLPPSPPSATLKVMVRAGKPARISILPGWRADLVPPIPSGWTTDNGYRDQRGNRIQVFEVVPPVTEVVLEFRFTKCATPQDCAW